MEHKILPTQSHFFRVSWCLVVLKSQASPLVPCISLPKIQGKAAQSANCQAFAQKIQDMLHRHLVRFMESAVFFTERLWSKTTRKCPVWIIFRREFPGNYIRKREECVSWFDQIYPHTFAVWTHVKPCQAISNPFCGYISGTMEIAHVPLKFGKEACASHCIDQTLSRFQSHCGAAQRCGERLREVMKGWFESLTICPHMSQTFQKWSEQNISGSKPFQGSFSICSSFMASKQPAELSYNLRQTHTPPHRTPKTGTIGLRVVGMAWEHFFHQPNTSKERCPAMLGWFALPSCDILWWGLPMKSNIVKQMTFDKFHMNLFH